MIDSAGSNRNKHTELYVNLQGYKEFHAAKYENYQLRAIGSAMPRVARIAPSTKGNGKPSGVLGHEAQIVDALGDLRHR
ncbi:hypothetical protein AB0J47_17225 [Nocardia sp. NPDC049737]|uniref:hypothetical protein n=1 Tax=Nocardia sp. NPDC049737 TaxID=3154358 RepID=UPI00341515DF